MQMLLIDDCPFSQALIGGMLSTVYPDLDLSYADDAVDFTASDGIGRYDCVLLDYRLPTTLDVPFIGTEILEEPSPDHPLGMRAVGQVPIVPPAGAIANAIRRAVGVRLRELPMNPERVFWALKKAEQQGPE